MPWPAYLALSQGFLASEVGQSADPTGQIIGQFLGYGAAGAVAIVLAIVLYRGTFTRAADAAARVAEAKADAAARAAEARADLLDQIAVLRGQLARAEEQRDEAVKLAQTQFVPLLTVFNGTVSNLLPVLQHLTRYDELPSRRWEPHEREQR